MTSYFELKITMKLFQAHDKNDFFLIPLFGALGFASFWIQKTYPLIQTKPDLSGLFFLLICFLSGIIGSIMIVVGMTRWIGTATQAFLKIILCFLYWLASSAIFIMLCVSTSFGMFLPIPIHFILVIGAIYASLLRVSDMRPRDYGMIFLIIFGIFLVLYGVPSLLAWLD